MPIDVTENKKKPNTPNWGVVADKFLTTTLAGLKSLPNPDEILKRMGKDIREYYLLIEDDQVFSCINTIKTGVRSHLDMIEKSGNNEIDRFVTEMIFDKVKRYRLMGEVVDGLLISPKPIEIYWQYDNWTDDSGQPKIMIIPADLKGKPPHWFNYSPNGELLFKTQKNPIGVAVPYRKFLVAQNESSYDNDYSYSRIRGCYWYVQFKKNDWRFLLSFAEKYGTPHLVGQTEENKIADLQSSLEDLRQDGSIAISKEDAITALQMNNISSVDIYSTIIELCNKAIVKCLLSHESSTQQTPGKLGNESNIQKLVQNVIDDYTRAIETLFNQLIEWTVDYNFPRPAKYPKYILYKQDDVDLTLADRDLKLAQTGQVQFHKSYLTKAYSFEDTDIDEKVATPQPLFAEHNHELDPAFAAHQDSGLEKFQNATEQLLKPIIAMVEANEDLDVVEKEMVKLFPHLDTDTIMDTIESAVLIANAKGKLSL